MGMNVEELDFIVDSMKMGDELELICNNESISDPFDDYLEQTTIDTENNICCRARDTCTEDVSTTGDNSDLVCGAQVCLVYFLI